MRALLDAATVIPPSGRPDEAGAVPLGRRDSRRIVLAAAERVREEAAQGDALAEAGARLLGHSGDEAGSPAFDRICERIDAAVGPSSAAPVQHWSVTLAPLFYDCAAAALAAGAVEEAVWGLVPLLQSPPSAPSGYLGLAVCAVRKGALQDAGMLAMASRADHIGHPRAYYLQGFGALQAGDRKSAQSLLATAARVARRDSRFIDDLRMAQQMLLLLQLQ